MNRLIQRIAFASMVVVLWMGVNQVAAQPGGGGGGGGQGGGRGNMDPAERQQMMMDRYKESFEVTDEAEWKLIQERIQKVMDARREAGGFGGGRGGMFGGRGGNRGGGDAAAQGDQQGQQRQRGGFNAAPNPTADALSQAIQTKASADDIKAKLAKYREDRKVKQAALEKAQEDLKKILNVRREAIAVTMGLLN